MSLQAGYHAHPATRRGQLKFDATAVALGLLVHAAMLRITGLTALKARFATSLANALLLLLQALFMATNRSAYYERRSAIHLLQRAVKTAFVVWRFLRLYALGPAGSGLDRMVSNVSQRAGQWRVSVLMICLEPLLALSHSMYHPLPLRLHLAHAAARLALDGLLVAPLLGCVLSRPQFEQPVAEACSWLHLLLTLCFPGRMGMLGDVCGRPGRAWFVPAALLLLAALAGFVASYAFELRAKFEFLRLAHPGEAHEVAGPVLGAAALLAYLHLGLVACLCGAQLLARAGPLRAAAMCHDW
jgi:hypothetical protein